MAFEALSLSDELLRAVRAASYETPTPIQTQAIPPALEGRDVLGCAQTGTGKTAAFVLPMLQRLMARAPSDTTRGARPIRMLVLTPTRELAAQIGETVRTLGKFLPLRSTVVFGGVGYEPQDRAMRAGVDILVSTPGRLIDHLGRGTVKLDQVEVLVLDEADQMLDMGFIHDVRRIVAKVPRERQTLFFSATMPPSIRALADEWLKSPVEVSVAPPATTAERVAQQLFYVETSDKRELLEELVTRREVTRALVFSRTKHGANKIARWLETAGVRAEPIHGNKSQNARTRALASFKSGTTRVLVATDLAARGLDIDEVTHVINFDLPNVPEVYVHRIGRTARAGNEGVAWSFCNVEEREFLWDIERTTRQKIPVVEDHPWASSIPVVERPQRGAKPAANGAPALTRSVNGNGNPRPARADGARRDGGRDGGRSHASPAKTPANHNPRPSEPRREGEPRRDRDSAPRRDGARVDGARSDGARSLPPRSNPSGGGHGGGPRRDGHSAAPARDGGSRDTRGERKGPPSSGGRSGGHGGGGGNGHRSGGGDRPAPSSAPRREHGPRSN